MFREQRNSYGYPNSGNLDKELEMASARVQQLQQMRNGVPQQSELLKSTWDKLDIEIDELTDSELQELRQTTKFGKNEVQLNQAVSSYMLSQIKPIILQHPDVRKMVDESLEVVKDFKKSIREKKDSNNKLMEAYLQNYSHVSFADFMDAVNNNTLDKLPKTKVKAKSNASTTV